jgi:hypothetical protein
MVATRTEVYARIAWIGKANLAGRHRVPATKFELPTTEDSQSGHVCPFRNEQRIMYLTSAENRATVIHSGDDDFSIAACGFQLLFLLRRPVYTTGCNLWGVPSVLSFRRVGVTC